MGGLFAKCTQEEQQQAPAQRAAPQANDHDRAVLKLKVARDKVLKLKKKLDLEITKSDEMVRALLSQKKKDKALLVLKRKKYWEKEYMTADGQLNNVTNLLSKVEFGAVQVEVFKSLESGNAALKNLQNQLSLEDAERIMDENAENLAYIDELSDLVSQNLTEEDNVELEEELEALGLPPAALGEPVGPNQGTVQTEVPDMPTVPDQPIMPDVPTHDLVAVEGAAKETEQRVLA